MFEREAEVAAGLARQSAELALRLQLKGVQAEAKADASPVTAADRESESFIAAELERLFPDDGLLGEEGSVKETKNGRRWIVDPIDGTRDFLRGNPLWAVLIGLEQDGEVKAGVAHLPMLGETYHAVRGGGAYRNGERIRVSPIQDRWMAALSVNGLHVASTLPFAAKLTDWMSTFWCVRSLGGTPDAMWLSSGRLEVWLEAKVAPWDLAAPQVILEEAGAVFHSHKGERTIYGGTAVAYVPALRPAVVELLGLK